MVSAAAAAAAAAAWLVIAHGRVDRGVPDWDQFSQRHPRSCDTPTPLVLSKACLHFVWSSKDFLDTFNPRNYIVLWENLQTIISSYLCAFLATFQYSEMHNYIRNILSHSGNVDGRREALVMSNIDASANYKSSIPSL